MSKEPAEHAKARARAKHEHPGHQIMLDRDGAVLARLPGGAWSMVDMVWPRPVAMPTHTAVRAWLIDTIDGCTRVHISKDGLVMVYGLLDPYGRYVGTLGDLHRQIKADPRPAIINRILLLRRRYGPTRLDIKRDGRVWVARAADGVWEDHGTLDEAYARIAPKT